MTTSKANKHKFSIKNTDSLSTQLALTHRVLLSYRHQKGLERESVLNKSIRFRLRIVFDLLKFD